MDSRLVLPVNTVLDGSYRIMRVVGSGGFGITYEAEDINLGTMVAIKEYYPFDFGDRDATMSVRPKSERHKQTFDWGRSNFLQEARTLARFEHPSIVRVTRVFEANATAYMVMRFERGASFEAWLGSLGRPPTQDELDAILHPLLDALEMMHAADFLHRDIAPDNIIVRADGTPVLLDFGAARRAVAEMSRSLTGIVKAGYSPARAVLLRRAPAGAVVGPLRARRHALPRGHRQARPRRRRCASTRTAWPRRQSSARGKYRRELPHRNRHLPQGAALRAAAVGGAAAADAARAHVAAEGDRAADRADLQAVGRSHAVPAQGSVQGSVAAEVLAGDRPAGQTPVAGDCRHGGDPGRRLWRLRVPALAHRGWGGRPCRAVRHRGRRGPAQGAEEAAQRQAALDTERRQKDKEAADARQRQFEIEEERRRKEMAETQRQAELAEARRRKEQADAAEAEARRKAEEARKEEARLAALEAARRKEQAEAEEKRRIAAQEEARRKADAEAAEKRRIAEAEAAEKRRIAALDDTRRAEETEAERKRREDQRFAALEEARRSEDRRKEDERLRLAAIPNDSPARRLRAQDAGDPEAASLLRWRCQRPRATTPRAASSASWTPPAARATPSGGGSSSPRPPSATSNVAQGRGRHQGQPVHSTAQAQGEPEAKPRSAHSSRWCAAPMPRSGNTRRRAPVLFRAAVRRWRGPHPGHPIAEDCINRGLHGPLEFPGACAI